MNKHLRRFEKVWKESYEMDIELDDFMRFDLCKEVMILDSVSEEDKELKDLMIKTKEVVDDLEVIYQSNGLVGYRYKDIREKMNNKHLNYVKKLKEKELIATEEKNYTKTVWIDGKLGNAFCYKEKFLLDCGVEL